MKWGYRRRPYKMLASLKRASLLQDLTNFLPLTLVTSVLKLWSKRICITSPWYAQEMQISINAKQENLNQQWRQTDTKRRMIIEQLGFMFTASFLHNILFIQMNSSVKVVLISDWWSRSWKACSIWDGTSAA